MTGTCDWGDCDQLATAWRWGRYPNGDPLGWLPVCEDHSVGYDLAA